MDCLSQNEGEKSGEEAGSRRKKFMYTQLPIPNL
jgi:hypothetical protein